MCLHYNLHCNQDQTRADQGQRPLKQGGGKKGIDGELLDEGCIFHSVRLEDDGSPDLTKLFQR